MITPALKLILRELGDWPLDKPVTLYWPKQSRIPRLKPTPESLRIDYDSPTDALGSVWAVGIAGFSLYYRRPQYGRTALAVVAAVE